MSIRPSIMWLLILPAVQLVTTVAVLLDAEATWLRWHWTIGALVSAALAGVNLADAWRDRREVRDEGLNGLLLLWTMAMLMSAVIALALPALLLAAGVLSLVGGQGRWALAALVGVNVLTLLGAVHQMIARRKMRAEREREVRAPTPPPGGWRRRATDRMELDDKNRLDSPWRPDEPPMT